jgi:hypothetical protein
VLHKYEVPAFAVSTTDPPWQNVAGPPKAIVAGGAGLTVTATGELACEHPFALVTVTE